MNCITNNLAAKSEGIDYRGIDVLKFIMAFAVIAIHAPEYLWPLDRVHCFFVDWFIRMAVPFFFISSGFLIQRKILSMDSDKERRRYLRIRAFKLLKIWCIWLLIYLPLSLWGYMSSSDPINRIMGIYLSDIFFTGHPLYAQQLWFVYSMAIIIFIWSISVLTKWGLLSLLCIFGAVSIIGHLIINDVITNISIWILGGGLPMMCGALIRVVQKSISNLQHWILILLCLTLSVIFKYLSLPYSELH